MIHRHLALWVAVLATAFSANTASAHMPSAFRRKQRNDDKPCPPCDLIFRKVKQTPGGERVQNVEMQERGEPKSGTGFMLEWAGGALMHTCDYLKKWFGEESCGIEWSLSADVSHDLKHMTMTFEPKKAGNNVQCPCPGIDRVSIALHGTNKHRLPVPKNCTVQHGAGMPPTGVCTFSNGSRPGDYASLWQCMREAACPIIDERNQMVIFRDPRSLVVSAYFYLLALSRTEDTVDQFVARMLPTFCQWVAVRYILFQGYMEDRSTFFWYDEAMDDPLAWHNQWLNSVGLVLPNTVVEAITTAAVQHEFGFPTKGVDAHPGAKVATATKRLYKDEVTPETLAFMDATLRRWLPPPLLAKFDAPPDVKLDVPPDGGKSSIPPTAEAASQIANLSAQFALDKPALMVLGVLVSASLVLLSCSCRQERRLKQGALRAAGSRAA